MKVDPSGNVGSGCVVVSWDEIQAGLSGLSLGSILAASIVCLVWVGYMAVLDAYRPFTTAQLWLRLCLRLCSVPLVVVLLAFLVALIRGFYVR